MEILFVLMLNIPVNFSVMSGQNHHFLGIACTFRGVNVSLLKDTTQPRPLAPESETLPHHWVTTLPRIDR